MRNKIFIMIGPLLLWACSVDPKQGMQGQNSTQAQQAADSVRENEGIAVENGNQGDVATNGSVVEVPVEEVKPGQGAESKPEGSQPAEIPPVAQGNKPGEENENSVTPPHKITGAFLVGEVLPGEEGETGTLKIGIVARQDDVRLSEHADRFDLNWKLQADESFGTSLRLVSTKNPAYDKILEFDGSLDELEEKGGGLAVHLLVSEVNGDTKLESSVKANLEELFKPVPAE